MRILHLVAYPVYSGPLAPTVALALAQRELGHEVYLAHDRRRDRQNPHEEPAGPRLTRLGLAPPVVLELCTKSAPWTMARDISRLHSFCRDTFDVIHVHTSHDHAVATLARTGVPIVRTVHAARTLRARPLQRTLLRRSAALIVRAESHRRRLAALVGRGVAITLIPGSVDAVAFAPRPGRRDAARRLLGLPSTARVVVHVALMAGRGQEELAGATVRVNSNDLHLLYVGMGERRAALELLCAAAGLAGKAHLPGYLDGEALTDAYAAADLAFLAQAGNDASARAALEAMASGLPLLAVAEDALADLVSDDVGYPIPSRDPEAIGAALRRWLDDPDASAKGERGRSHVESARRVENEASSTLAVYAQALGRAPR